MNTLLLTLAFLCGVPIGIILGLIVAWRMYRPERGDREIDYSGGV